MKMGMRDGKLFAVLDRQDWGGVGYVIFFN
jgi:hypothetical protein